MIQRIQTIYLLLAVAGMVVFYFVGLAVLVEGNQPAQIIKVCNMTQFAQLPMLLTYAAPLLLLGALVLASYAVFLFKNRKKQMRMVSFALLLNMLVLVDALFQIDRLSAEENTQAVYGLGLLVPIVVLMLLVLAIRGIRHDEKLVKSTDRLR